MFESVFDKYPFFRAVPCVLCMAIIFKLSSLTTEQLQDFPHVWDKLAHFCEYATLAGCYAMLWTRNEWSKRQWLVCWWWEFSRLLMVAPTNTTRALSRAATAACSIWLLT